MYIRIRFRTLLRFAFLTVLFKIKVALSDIVHYPTLKSSSYKMLSVNVKAKTQELNITLGHSYKKVGTVNLIFVVGLVGYYKSQKYVNTHSRNIQ